MTNDLDDQTDHDHLIISKQKSYFLSFVFFFFWAFCMFKTTFKAALGEEPVVVDLQGLGKGQAWVNGQSLGRYWPAFMPPNDCGGGGCDYRGAYKSDRCLDGCDQPTQRW